MLTKVCVCIAPSWRRGCFLTKGKVEGYITLSGRRELTSVFLQDPGQRRGLGLWIKNTGLETETLLQILPLLPMLCDLGQITSVLCAMVSQLEKGGWGGG